MKRMKEKELLTAGLEKTKGFAQEFKEFISRGNVVDMAVGVIIGTSFTAIVNSLVKDVMMPFIGWLMGGINFTDLRWIFSPASGDVPEAALYYGNFIQKIVDFLIVAFVVFCMVKLLSVLRRKRKAEETEAVPETPAEPEIPEDVRLLTEIRDLLKEKKTEN